MFRKHIPYAGALLCATSFYRIYDQFSRNNPWHAGRQARTHAAAAARNTVLINYALKKNVYQADRIRYVCVRVERWEAGAILLVANVPQTLE